MNRLSTYILQHLVWATSILTAILVFAVWLTQSLRLIEVIVDGAAPVSIFLTLVMLSMPNFLIVVLPIATIGATLFAYNRLTMDSELVVMRAAGIGQLALMRPALVLAGAVMGICYLLNALLLPMANQEFRRISILVDTEFAAVFLQEGQFNAVSDSISIYFRDRQPTGELLRILVHDNREPTSPVTIIGERGLLVDIEGTPRVVLFDGRRQEVDRETGQMTDLLFDQYAIDLDILRPDLGYTWIVPRERFVGDLLYPDPDDPSDVQHWNRLRAAGHDRLTAPLMVPAYVALGLGIILSGQHARRGNPLRMLTASIAVLGVLGAHTGIGNIGAQLPLVFPLFYILPIITIIVGLSLPYAHRVIRRRRPRIPDALAA